MPRPPSKKTLRNKLDKLCSLIVRKRGKCEKCGDKRYEQLQCCHVFSRKYGNTRHDTDNNLLCLCASCHRLAHDNPILFTEWVRKHLGEERYEALKEAHNQIYKPTIYDLQVKLKVLEGMR